MAISDHGKSKYTSAGLERAFPQFYGFEQIAQTGFSAVFAVSSRIGGPRLALKLTRVVNDNDLLLHKFDAEYRLLSTQNNDHLVTVTAYGRANLQMSDGELAFHCWYAMHLYEGGSVLSRLGELDLRSRLTIVDQLLVGLSYLHTIGVAHRDIKPHNLFLERLQPPTLRIGDFGIAKDGGLAGGDAGHSRMVGGTPQYLAPERLSADYLDQHRPDWRPSDQYAAGVTIYQILAVSGLPLRVGADSWGQMSWGQIRDAHLGRPLRPLRVPELPDAHLPRVDQVIARMMAIAVEDRYPKVHECRRSLHTALLTDGLLS